MPIASTVGADLPAVAAQALDDLRVDEEVVPVGALLDAPVAVGQVQRRPARG